MKICLRCNARFQAPDWKCPICQHVPYEIDGMPAIAPDLAEGGAGFRAEYFEKLATLESGNFWFRARNALLLQYLRKHFPGLKSFLEIGCGTGFVLSAVSAAWPAAQLTGSEAFSAGLAFAQQRIPRAEFLQMDARNIPYDAEFQVVGAFDVIEHIDDDEKVLAELFRAALPGGGMLLSVPQHPWFWSYQDELACHVRRYSTADLKRKVERVGFEVIEMISFVSLLFPLMWLSRRARNPQGAHTRDALADLRINPVVNVLLKWMMDVERWMISCGVRFPAGGSLLLVARKPV